MVLTAQTAQKHLEHALGGPSEFEPLSTMNQAGRFLVGMRNWRWLRGASAVLAMVQNQDFVDLPADLKHLTAIEQTNSLVGTFARVAIHELLNMRTSTVAGTSTTFFGAVVWARDTYTTAGTEKPGAPTQRLEIWPSPSATNTLSLTVYYERGWVDFSEDNQFATIPPFMEALYIQVLRAFALGYEEDAEANVNERLAQIPIGPVYNVAMREDVQNQREYGKIRGGVAAQGHFLNRYSAATIDFP